MSIQNINIPQWMVRETYLIYQKFGYAQLHWYEKIIIDLALAGC